MRQEEMTRTIQEQSATIRSLESTIKNLEELLLKKEDALSSAEEQKKALGKLIGKKNEKVRTAFVPKTEEERAEEERRREEERKARGNNGAKRNMHYEMTVEEKDVRPDDSIVGNADADFILEQANLLYANEHQHTIGTDGWTEEDNLRWRRTYAPPILRKLKAALQKVVDSRDKYPPKSPMHKAAQYFLNEFDGIEAIFRTGGCDLDTNRLERLNRYVSLSRRNSLFFGSHEGAERGALFYSLSCSCRLCGVDFFEYLTDVIDRVVAMGPRATADSCRDLLPDRWKPQA